MSTCTTHHHACQCREANFRLREEAYSDLQSAFELSKDAYQMLKEQYAALVDGAKKSVRFCPDKDNHRAPSDCGIYGCKEMRDALKALGEVE